MIEILIEDRLDGWLNVSLSGELDADNAQRFIERVTEVHQVPDGLTITTDGLEFIDSSGISAFLRLRERVIEGGGSFVVSRPMPAVRRIFDIAGLLDVFGLS